MTPRSSRQHDAFANPANAACRAGNLRVLRKAAYLTRGRAGRMKQALTGEYTVTHLRIRGVAMSEAVHEILQSIQQLPEEDRLILEEHLAQLAEVEWERAAQESRQLARQKGIDQSAIDRAVENVRYRP